MAGAAKLSVPLITDVGVGVSWNDAHYGVDSPAAKKTLRGLRSAERFF